MKKKQILAVVLAGIVLLSLGSCGKTADDSTETAFEAYYQSVSDDDIVFESETCFVDSQILLTASDGVTQSQIEKLVKKQNGSIVGYISISNDYQIEFADGKTYEELDAIISEWSNNDNVEAASLNYASQIETASIDYTKDPWIDADNASNTSGSEWSETAPEGNNWWAEAIMMPSVWNMDTEFQPVKVGIYDTMFDTDNEDLAHVFIKIWNAPEDEDGNCMVSTLYNSAKQANQVTTNYAHGTHVAGLIAAKAENGFGIAGVSQNAELYGFSFKSASVDTEGVSRWDDLFEIKYSIALMLNEGVKVMNFSVSEDELLVAAQHGVEKALTALEELSISYESFFKKCLDAGYDFLIVKGAGNQNGYNWVPCEITEDNPYGYTKDSTAIDDTVYDAQYDFLGAIEDETVKAHILIVGAAENQINYYTTAYFSTVGNRVDVYAPGVDILSDFPTNITAMDKGTSMATPIVSGIAALVWGANPDLSAIQVASIIRASASVSMFDSESVSNIFKTVETTPIVNAYFAVQLALNTSGEGNDAASTAGIITGMAYITEDDGTLTALSDASVTVADSDGNTVETAVTSDLSGYTFILPAGTYTITAELDGYETVSKEVTLAENDVLNVDFEMEEAQPALTAEDAEIAYQTIIDEYIAACSVDSIDFMADKFAYLGKFPNVAESELMYYHSYGNFHFCYVYYDIDDNGVPELLIGTQHEASVTLVDAYAFDGNEAIKIVDSYTLGDRASLTVFTNGILYFYASGGASYGEAIYYCLDEDGYTLKTIVKYTEDYNKYPDTPYYNNDEKLTWNEFNAIYEQYTQIELNDLNWTIIVPVIDSTSTVEPSDKPDLREYFNMNIYDFATMMGGMDDIHSTDGIELTNGAITASANYDDELIFFFAITSDCNYSIDGIEYGVSISDARKILDDYDGKFSLNGANDCTFDFSDGSRISVYADTNGYVDRIYIWLFI